jgi:hypothetical protein
MARQAPLADAAKALIVLRIADEDSALVAFELACLGQSGLQLPAGAVQPHLDRGLRQLQKLRDFLGAEPVAVVQQKNRLVTVGQLGNLLPNAGAHFVPLDRGKRRRLFQVCNLKVFDRFGRLPLRFFGPPPQVVDADMRGNPIKPTLRGCRVSQRILLHMRANKSFLGKVLGLGGIPNQVTDIPRYRSAVALKFIWRRR